MVCQVCLVFWLNETILIHETNQINAVRQGEPGLSQTFEPVKVWHAHIVFRNLPEANLARLNDEEIKSSEHSRLLLPRPSSTYSPPCYVFLT